MEDVMQMDMPLTVTSGVTTVGTTSIPNTLNQLIVGKALNTPRSMAIAYDTVSIDGAAIHLTEIGTNAPSLPAQPVFLEDGWSQPITNIFVWIFCKVDSTGTPVDAGGIPVVPIPLLPAPGIPAALTLGSRASRLVPGGGFASCVKIDSKNIGCIANRDNVPLASPALYLAVSFEPTPTQGGSGIFANYTPTARSISVTLHTVTTEQKGASFTPMP